MSAKPKTNGLDCFRILSNRSVIKRPKIQVLLDMVFDQQRSLGYFRIHNQAIAIAAKQHRILFNQLSRTL